MHHDDNMRFACPLFCFDFVIDFSVFNFFTIMSSEDVVLHKVKKVDREKLRKVFLKYATLTHGKLKEPCMKRDDFVRNYLGLFREEPFNRTSVNLVANAADRTKDGLITFDEFEVEQT